MAGRSSLRVRTKRFGHGTLNKSARYATFKATPRSARIGCLSGRTNPGELRRGWLGAGLGSIWQTTSASASKAAIPGGELRCSLHGGQPPLIHRFAHEPGHRLDVATASAVQTIPALGTNNFSLALSPDGRLLAVGGFDGMIKVWDLQHERLLKQFQPHQIPVYGLLSLIKERRSCLWPCSRTVRWK